MDFTVQDYKDADKAARQDLEEKIEKIKANFSAKIKGYGRLALRKSAISGELVSLKSPDLIDDKTKAGKTEKRIAQLEKELSAVLTKMDEEERNKIY